MRKTALKKVSDKRQEQNEVYFTLINQLRLLCGNKSELSGKAPTWESNFLVEPHHFEGRIGDNFINPFGMELFSLLAKSMR